MPVIREILILIWEAAKLAGCFLILLLACAVAMCGVLFATLARHAVRVEDDAPPDDWPVEPEDPEYTVITDPEEAMAAVLAAMERGDPIEHRDPRSGEVVACYCGRGHRHPTVFGARFCEEMRK